VSWLWGVLVAAAAMATAVYVHVAVRPQRGARRWWIALPALLNVACLPLWVPMAKPGARFLIAVAGALYGAKIIEFVRRPGLGRAAARGLGRFVVWFSVPAEVSWPAKPEARLEARKNGAKRLLRALFKLALLVAVLALAFFVPAVFDNYWSDTLWSLWFTYLWVTAAFDLFTGLVMLWGIEVSEIFDMPFLARGVVDFWGKRWNVFFRNWVHRHLFLPLRPGKRPAVAVAAAFAFSMAIHEYLVVVTLGRTEGHMALFFLLQGAATLAILMARRRWRNRLPSWLSVALLWVWLTATGGLFFAPMAHILPVNF